MNPSSSEIDGDFEQFRRFSPGGNLPIIPNAKNLSDMVVRRMFNIPKSVKFTKMMSPTDTVCDDEVAVNLHQLACGFPMPVDSFTFSLLNSWKISPHQMHPSLCLALKRVLSIFKAYYRLILPEDVQKFITPSGRQMPGIPWKIFSCECKHPNVNFRLNGFPKCYQKWNQYFYKFKNWKSDDEGSIPLTPTDDDYSEVRMKKFFNLPRSLFDVSLSDEFVDWRYERGLDANEISAPTHAVPLNQRPGVTVAESDSESYDGCSPKVQETNPTGTSGLQGSSSPSSLFRIRRRHYKTKVAGANTSDTHDFGASNRKGSFKRLRKGDQPLSFAFNSHRPKNPLVNKASKFVTVPDAMSGKICQAVRRSTRLINKDYTFKEVSSSCPAGVFSPSFDGNRESTDSGSSDEVLGMETESSDDNSSGCPSPTTDLGDAQVPLGREAVRGNDSSSTVFVDDDLTNVSLAHKSTSFPGHRGPSCDNGEKVIQEPLPNEFMPNVDIFADRGMMGSGSSNPCPENENARVCRPYSVPQYVTGINRPAHASPSSPPVNAPDCGALLKTMTEYCNQLLNSAAQLDGALKQRALDGGADVGLRLEVTLLKSENSELSAANKMLTEELARTRQELANSESRVLQLKLSLEEIGGVLPDSWEN